MVRKKQPRRDAGRPRGEPIESALLAQTLEELAAHGLAGVSVDRIARAADVNKTSVYRRFGSREALIAAALERVAVDVDAALTDQGSLRQDLELIATRVAALLRAPVGRSLALAAMGGASDSILSQAGARAIERPNAAVRAMVARAMARGEWREGVTPEVVLGALVGALLHRALLEKASLSPSYVRQVVDLVAEGIRRR